MSSEDNELILTKNEYLVKRNEGKHTAKTIYEKPEKVKKKNYSNEYIANFTAEKKKKMLNLTENRSKKNSLDLSASSKSLNKGSTIKSSKRKGGDGQFSKTAKSRSGGFQSKSQPKRNNFNKTAEFSRSKSAEKFSSVSTLKKGENEFNTVKKNNLFNKSDLAAAKRSFGNSSQGSLKKEGKFSETSNSKFNTGVFKDTNKLTNEFNKEGLKATVKSATQSKENLIKIPQQKVN